MSGKDDDEVYVLFLGLILSTVLAGGVYGFTLWLAGQVSGLLSGAGWPDSGPSEALGIALGVVRNPGDPSAAWPASAAGAVASGPLFLIPLLVLFALATLLIYGFVRLVLNLRRVRPARRLRLGFASSWEVRRLLSARTVLAKAGQVRPSTARLPAGRVRPEDVGFHIGRDIRSRRKMYASVEDTVVVISAPRQGKDVHFVTPFTIDAPGACIVTSTRRETFVHTAMVRARFGEVLVFDPYNFTKWPHRLRWSPLQGCEDPNVCAVRSGTLVESSGLKFGVEGVTGLSGVLTVIRCLLHAGAIGGLTLREVMGWVYSADADAPTEILRRGELDGRVAAGYSAQLQISRRDERVWAGVAQVMHAFSHPDVLENCSPPPGEEFDLKEFLKGRNTLYIIGKQQSDHGGIAPVVTTMIEQFWRTARATALQTPSGRLDPPLTFELNQVTDICPIGGLPTYMGESGGYSIAVHVYLTSLAEARVKWGGDGAARLWDNAAVRIISGGAGTAKDLSELSDLVGKPHGRQVLLPDELRTMPFGRAAVVAGTARPVEMWLTPWWKRGDRAEVQAGKDAVEGIIRKAAAR